MIISYTRMAAMKIHISASAKEALDALGGYYTEIRGNGNYVNIISVQISGKERNQLSMLSRFFLPPCWHR